MTPNRSNHFLAITVTVWAAILILFLLALCPLACSGQDTGHDLQEQINTAAEQAAARNMTATVLIPDGAIIRLDPGQTITVPSHVFLTTPSGQDRSWRIVARGLSPGQAVVTFSGNSYAAGVRGLSITYAETTANQITGIRTSGQTKNPLIENCHIDLWGRMDCVGLEIRGHESVIVRRFMARASVPIKMVAGDNHHLEDLDITAATSESHRLAMNSTIPSTCVWIVGMPNQWTFGGSFTAQGGDHAFFGRVDSPKTGQVLRIEGLRYEQSLSNYSEDHRVIDLKFTDRALERMVLFGCRWGGNRRKGIKAIGVWNVDRIGCYTQGTFWTRKEAPNGRH